MARVHTLASSAKCCGEVSGIYLLGAHYRELNHLGTIQKKKKAKHKPTRTIHKTVCSIPQNQPFPVKGMLVVFVLYSTKKNRMHPSSLKDTSFLKRSLFSPFLFCIRLTLPFMFVVIFYSSENELLLRIQTNSQFHQERSVNGMH